MRVVRLKNEDTNGKPRCQIRTQALEPVATLQSDWQRAFSGGGDQRTQRLRDSSETPFHPEETAVAAIAAKQFVAPVAAQCDGAMATDQLTYEECRNHRRIEHRLVELPRQPRQQVGRRRLRLELDMLGLEMTRDQSRVLGLVDVSHAL